MRVISPVNTVLVEGEDHRAGVRCRAHVNARLDGETEVQRQVPAEVHAHADLACERGHAAGIPLQFPVVGAVKAFLVVVGVAERYAGPGVYDQGVILPFRPEDPVVMGVGEKGADLPCAGAQEAVEIGAEGDGVHFLAGGGVERGRDAETLGRLEQADPLSLGVCRRAERQQQRKQTKDMDGFQHGYEYRKFFDFFLRK